jgi:transmembrane protein TMEM260 (protein O-mannosyltransferase)
VLRRVLLLWIGILTLYCFTLAPTFLWSDSAKLAIFAYEKDFVSAGFGVHPGHSLLGYIFSFLPFAFAYTQNLMSAVFGSLAVLFLFLIIRMRASDSVAMISAVAFGVSHLFWHYSVINETYSPFIFFLAAFLYCVLRSNDQPAWLYLASLLLGFGYSNHASILLVLPGCIVLLWNSKSWRLVAGAQLLVLLLLFFIGGCQAFILPLFSNKVIGMALSGDLIGHLHIYWQGASKLVREVIRYPLYLAYQFPTIAFVFGIYGLLRLWKVDRKYALGTLIIWFSFLVFSLEYFLQRQFALMIPTFFVFALWIPAGLEAWLQRLKQIVSHRSAVAVSFIVICVLPGFIYYSVYRVAEERGVSLAAVRELPYRNNLRYFLFPPKNFEHGAETYVNDCFQQAAPGAVILADFNPGVALQYGQIVMNQRTDLAVQILDPWLFSSKDPAARISEFLRQQLAEKKTVYLADNWGPYYKITALSNEFQFAQEGGPLWRVKSIRPLQ